jgi:L-lactate dehydrogenase
MYTNFLHRVFIEYLLYYRKFYFFSGMKPKIAIIGAGNVGSHIVSSSILKNISADFLLIDMNEKFENAQVLDIKDILLFSPNSHIKGSDFGSKELSEADIFVITAGVSQKPGETRCELLGRNVKILQEIKNAIGTIKPSALVIIVTNPVDILTQMAKEIFGLPKNQVFGTGTLLDSARLEWRLAEKLNRNILDVKGYVLGEHGDSEFVAWSSVSQSEKFSPQEREKIETSVKKEAYEIIEGKGSTFFGIGGATAELLSHIVNDSQKIFPLSCPLNGEYGIEGISIGVPAKIGKNGIEEIYEIPLKAEEYKKLLTSAEKLKTLFCECSR